LYLDDPGYVDGGLMKEDWFYGGLALLFYALVVILIGYGIYSTPGHTKQEPKAYSYCIDPWTSEDMGTVTYTPCALTYHRWKA
jgi:hypothetical protein